MSACRVVRHEIRTKPNSAFTSKAMIARLSTLPEGETMPARGPQRSRNWEEEGNRVFPLTGRGGLDRTQSDFFGSSASRARQVADCRMELSTVSACQRGGCMEWITSYL